MNGDVFSYIATYQGLLVLHCFVGLLIPIPEELAVMYAGVSAASGRVSFALAFVVVVCGLMIRDTIAYLIGRAVGRKLIYESWIGRMLGHDKLDFAEKVVARRGALTALVGRAMIGIRAPVFVIAGAMRVPPGPFFAWDLGAIAATTTVLMSLGLVFGEPLIAVASEYTEATALTVIAVGVVASAIFWRFVSRQVEAS